MDRGRDAETRRDPDWIKTRDYVLRRDKWQCKIGGPHCTRWATTADHIIPRAEGGSDDPRNLRAACVACNCGRRPTTTTQPRSVTRW